MRRYLSIVEKTIIVTAFLLFSCATTPQSQLMKEEGKTITGSGSLQISAFDQAVSMIEDAYVDDSGKHIKLDTSKRPDIGSLISQLSPQSKWMSAEDAEIVSRRIVVGIGAEVRLKDSSFEIFNVLASSPAQHAGLRRGDKIIEINNEPVARLSLTQVREKLEGAPDTEIVLKVATRKNETKMISMIRKTLKSGPSVAVHMMGNKVAYMRIARFRSEVPADVEQAVKRLLHEDMQGLVLDLRLNSGGDFRSTTETAQLFLKQGEIICTLIGNEANKVKAYMAQGPIHHTSVPLVVLIDSATESGAEIVAAALKENKRALLVGEKTPGKGEVQTVFPLKDGSGIMIRTAYVYSPAGERIEDRGIKPDRELVLSDEERDAHYERINSFSNKDFEKISSDIQLKTAVALLRDQTISPERLEKNK